MKRYLIAVLVVIVVVSFTGLAMFETSLWIAFAVMAVIEALIAFLLFTSRWRNRRAAVVVAVLAAFQVGQSYFYDRCGTPRVIR